MKQKASAYPQHLGDKIKHIRTAKGFSQESMAYALKIDRTVVVRLESGQIEISNERLTAIKKFLEIENAPLFEHEVKISKNRLLMAQELLIENRLPETLDIFKSQASVRYVPFEQELYLLYTMIEIRLLLKEYKDAEAKEKFDLVAIFIDDASVDVQHMFHHSMGMYLHENEPGTTKSEALRHLEQALAIGTNEIKLDPNIFTQIGIINLMNGKPIQAIVNLERTVSMYGDSRTNTRAIAFCRFTLSNCYQYVNDFDKALEHNNAVLDLIVNTQYNYEYSVALGNMGAIYRHAGNAKKGLEYIEKSIAFDKENGLDGNEQGIHAMFCKLCAKALCLLDMKKYTECRDAIAQAGQYIQQEDWMPIVCESVVKFTKIRDTCSTDYIENVALPFLRASKDTYLMHFALDFCARLKAFYAKRGADKKANAAGNIAGEIFMEIIFGKRAEE